MSIHEYIASQRENSDKLKSLPEFEQLARLVDQIYMLSSELVPKDSPKHFGMLLLLCHKSFLSAAALTIQAQPEDAGAITRRATEMAKVALATKYNEANAEIWSSTATRILRWEAREKGEKPPRLPPMKYDLPADHEALKCLEMELGLQSDMNVHFTPEFFLAQRWEMTPKGVHLFYFETDLFVIRQSLIRLADVHALMFSIYNECLDQALEKNGKWTEMNTELIKIKGELSAELRKTATERGAGIQAAPRSPASDQ
jgi:hypothetical protein